jgi:hypothetical protein
MTRMMIVIMLAGFAFVFSGTNGRVASLDRVNTEPQRLEAYVGKYPSELFKGAPSLKQRLRTLLGANYSVFMQRLQTEMPIENDRGALVGRGCMAHSCGSEEAVFVISLSDGKLHCAILSQKFGGKYKVFSEDKNHIPPALNRAMQQP